MRAPPTKQHEVIDLSAYRAKKRPVRGRKAVPKAANDEELIETITYHLLMAARAIEARQR
jgi:hypothetical protein